MIEHINHVETPGIFGTHMEILAMATYYGVPVFYCCLQGHSQQQYRWHCVRPISSKDNHLRYPELAGSPLEHVEGSTVLYGPSVLRTQNELRDLVRLATR